MDPNLDVQLAETVGDWARVVCSNGWSAWVDRRQLVAIGPPPASGPPGSPGPPLPRLLTEPSITIRARVRGLSLWGWHVNLSADDGAGAQIGGGGGLGKRGQVVGKGFVLHDELDAPVLTVVPAGDELTVSDGAQRVVGSIGRIRHGLGGLVKPLYELRSGGVVHGRVSSDNVAGTRKTVTDQLGQEVATIADVTFFGRATRSGSCRLDVNGPLDLPLRQLVVAAAADAAMTRMKLYNRPRDRF
jgi:hypothetical protein